MTTETPNTEPKTERKRRNQSYVVLELVECIDRGKYAQLINEAVEKDAAIKMQTITNCAKMSAFAAWAPVTSEAVGVELEFDDLAACDRWIRNNGADGSTYRPARVADAVEVTTRTETVRELKTL